MGLLKRDRSPAGLATIFCAVLVLISINACSNPDETPESTREARSWSEGKLVALNGTDLYVREMGSGEPIIIIHGGPVLEHGYLLPHLEKMADSHRLIFFDQRLSGRSSSEVAEGDITFAKFLGDIDAVREHVGDSTAHIMGHSWGGLLAMMYAAKYPERTRSLILISPMPASWDDWQDENERLAALAFEEDLADRRRVMESEAFEKNLASAFEELYRISFRSQFHDRSKVDALSFYVPDDLSVRSQRFAALMPELEGYDLYESLRSLLIPTLLVYGAAEPAASLSGLKIRDAIPNVTLAIIPDAGHFSFVESPEDFHAVINRFFGTETER